MLYLYQSNRLEDLAKLLFAVQVQNPLDSALEQENIVVLSKGMQRFLKREMAKQYGIAANLRFHLPAQFSWTLTCRVIPNLPKLNPFEPEVMLWRLLDLFHDTQRLTEFAPHAAHTLQHYIERGETAAYGLAKQLADIFDQYLVYRSDWIQAWQEQRLLNLGDDEIWQAELWRYLEQTALSSSLHRVSTKQILLQNLDKRHLPQRLFVFGIAFLAPMYLELFKTVAKHCDVHIFALNPCAQYWGDVIEPIHLLNQENSEMEHIPPLLASLGKQGRDFFHELSESNPVCELAPYEELMPSANLLQRLQFDIQTLRINNTHIPLDDSIQLVSAHSPLRELQILKDNILKILGENPDWQAHDIAVLTPKIDPYLPFIETVFGQETEGSPSIPYSISDIRVSRRQPLLYALEEFLTLMESRFENEKVLSFLENDVVLNRFQLNREDLPFLHQLIQQLHIHWGLNHQMREHNDLFTWKQGLNRLMAGCLLPQTDQALWQNISPFPCNINQFHTITHFVSFIQTLERIYQEWQSADSIQVWTERFRQLTKDLFQPAEQDHRAVQEFERKLSQWQEEVALANFSRPISLTTALNHLKHFLAGNTDNGFLRSGITFCSLVPMRNLPFKMICLLGLNEADYPRNTKASSFDLIAQHPKRGDRSRRDDDRYLFLEVLMSAREKLYLSYIGKNIQNNEELAPSALIGELIDTLAIMTHTESAILRKNLIQHHPLQAFSRRYFDGSGLQSSRQDYANALNQPYQESPAFLHDFSLSSSPNTTYLSQKDLIAFWKNPVRHWLKQLKWERLYLEKAWESAEPFTPTDMTYVYATLLQARRQKSDPQASTNKLHAESVLPEGEIGKLFLKDCLHNINKIENTWFNKEKNAPYSYQLTLGKTILSGTLEHLYQDCQLYFMGKTPNYPERIGLILEHLIASAVLPSAPRSVWLTENSTLVLPPIASETAHDLLLIWIQYYHIGQGLPLPFFPSIALTAAENIQKQSKKKNNVLTPEEIISDTANKAYFDQVENYTENLIVFGKDDVAPINSDLFVELITKMVLPTLIALNPPHQAEESSS